MAIIENTASNTIVFTQITSEEGNRNTQYTGLMGNPQGVLGGFNLLPGRDELYDYTSQLGKEASSHGLIVPGLHGVAALLSAVDITSIPGNSNAILGKGFVLGIDATAFIGVEHTLTASNSITFTQPVVDVDRSKPRTASSTITFTQTNALVRNFSVSASNTIVFAQSNVVSGTKRLTASSSITFTQNSAPGLISRTASNHLSLTQSTALGETDILTASNTIVFTQSANPGVISRTASNHLFLVDNANGGLVGVNAIPLTASSTVVFTQTNNRGIIFPTAVPLTADNTLVFTQHAVFPKNLTASNTIDFTQTNVSNVGKSVTQVIEFTQTVVANVWRSLTASNTIEFKHGFSAVQFRDGVPVVGTEGCDATKLYAPYAGGDAPLIRPVSPTLSRKTDVIFFTPVGPICNATESITLRTPNFGDRDRNQLARINRESRGGSLTIFRDPKWTKERTLVMDFSGIKDSEVDDILAFLENTLGQQVSFRDWNSRVWTGVIVNPDSAITRTGSDRNDIALEMEVVASGLELHACNTIVFTQSNDREVI